MVMKQDIPVKPLLVDQNAHKLDNAHGGVSVVELNAHLRGKD